MRGKKMTRQIALVLALAILFSLFVAVVAMILAMSGCSQVEDLEAPVTPPPAPTQSTEEKDKTTTAPDSSQSLTSQTDRFPTTTTFILPETVKSRTRKSMVTRTTTTSPPPTKAKTTTTTKTISPKSPGAVAVTFDDGPGGHTARLLDALKQYDVKATFFVQGQFVEKYPDLIRRMHQEGHQVANHTYSHKTDEIYASQEALLADIQRNRDLIAGYLGEDYTLDLFRFPKGSTNKGCRDFRDAVKEAGYRYFDWNTLNGDAESSAPRTAQELYERLVQTIADVDGRKKEVIVLMHDTKSKTATVEMLPDAIDYLLSLGYEFRTMENLQMK